ncbi:MAG: 5'-methylthioadenosine/adenosylhomocysteine nucleosidase [Lachnospira sp.]|nr:5'-methylthioadenosine/adenosylhomocysteine nucleosidase [Lachnospira sp.]
MIGIIGAMKEEVEEIVAAMTIEKEETKAKMLFRSGKLEGKDVVIVISGIGKVNAAACTQILADDFHVDCVVNTGIAGSLKNEINIADVVVSEDVMHHDMDTTIFGYALGEVPGLGTASFQADERLVKIAKESIEAATPEIGVYVGRVVSGDQFIASKDVKDKLVENFHGYCAEMEGASIAQTAFLNEIPFVIIRTISDKADDSASMDYPVFEKKASEQSVKFIKEFVKRV